MNEISIKHLIILMFLSCPAFSQVNNPVTTNHFICYETGSNWLKEEILIPKVHKGISSGFNYRFEKSGKNFHMLQMALGYGKLKTELETEKVTQNGYLNLDYSIGYNLYSGEKVNYFSGFNAAYSWSLMEYPIWDESRAYWATSLSIGLFSRLMVALDKNRLWITSCNINMLGILSRSDEIRYYAQEDWLFFSIINTTHSDFKPGFVNNILMGNFRTEYRIPMKKGRHFSLLYSMFYSKTAKSFEPPLLINRNKLGIGFGF